MRFFLPSLCVCLAGLATAAAAQDFDVTPYGTTRGWQVDSLTDGSGFLGCAGSVEQGPGFLILAKTRDGWMLRVPTRNTEGFDGAVIEIDGYKIDSQVGYTPEGAGEAYLDAGAIPRLANGSRLTVAINNDQTTKWALSGSAAMITKVEECYSRKGKAPQQAAAKPAAPAPAAVESDALRMGAACPAVGEVRSGGNTTPAQVTFQNAADMAISIYWLDFNGTPVEYAGLLPGDSYSVDTWTEHYWLAKDFDGTCHGGVIVPAPGAQIVTLR